MSCAKRQAHRVQRRQPPRVEPQKGRAIDADDMHAAMAVFKRNNINAVRMPLSQPSLWYDLCDQNGIYMDRRANLESHGSWQSWAPWNPAGTCPAACRNGGTAWSTAPAACLNGTKNHAAVLIWSCGNESYAGEDIRAWRTSSAPMTQAAWCITRGVFHCREFDDISDMESRMYAKPSEIIAYMAEHPAKPFILCEYMHDMGNSLGGMESYVGPDRKRYKKYQGGFIWDYMDQAFGTQIPKNDSILGYGGDFGDRTTDYNFSGNGIVWRWHRKACYAGGTLLVQHPCPPQCPGCPQQNGGCPQCRRPAHRLDKRRRCP